jgi:hypothetical protein
MWKLVFVHLEIVCILTQDRCTVCFKHTTGSEIILDAPMELLGDVSHLESHLFPFGDNVSAVQDRCIVCARHTIGSEIILDALDVTTR